MYCFSRGVTIFQALHLGTTRKGKPPEGGGVRSIMMARNTEQFRVQGKTGIGTTNAFWCQVPDVWQHSESSATEPVPARV